MKNIKEVVCENLISLRKSNNMTQIDLAKKINYSDKAISRWEKGEVAPDYEILQTICNIYNVPIGYLFEEHKNNETRNSGNKGIIFLLLYASIIWTIVTIAYVYLQTLNSVSCWQLFIWGVPLTAIICLYCNKKYFKNQVLFIIFQSILVWSTLTGFYLQTLTYNIWPVFLIGAPAQCVIIAASFIKKR